MTDTQFTLVFLMGFLTRQLWVWAMTQINKEPIRIYDWEANDDEFGW